MHHPGGLPGSPAGESFVLGFGEDVLRGHGHELSLGLDIHVLRAASVDRRADLAAFADRAGAGDCEVEHESFIGRGGGVS
jgi:hypothetical protein